MIKLIFFDIDGTLIPFNTGKLPESAKASILKLQKNGIRTFIATGKSLARLTKMEVMKVPFSGYLTLNGQLCYDSDYQLIFGYPIIPEEMQVLEQIFKDDKIPFILIGEFAKYINFMNDKMLANLIETNDSIPDIGEYRGEKIYQITACISAKQRKILENTMDYCEITSWSPDAVDIFCKGGGKMNAIEHLLKIYGVTPDEIMAFGDAENDINMLKYAGIGVAMGNATDECKAAADYITTDINDNGIENALKLFGLID